MVIEMSPEKNHHSLIEFPAQLKQLEVLLLHGKADLRDCWFP